jgi:VWFA-related protein
LFFEALTAAMAALTMTMATTPSPPTQQPPPLVFASSAELVRVVVSVTDPQGRPVRGLRREDFTLKDDGKKREIVTAVDCDRAHRDTPADCQAGLGLLFDTSRSMETILDPARDAAVAFAASVPEARVGAVVSFESRVTVWPADREQLAATLDLIILESKGTGTRFFEGVLKAADGLVADPSPRPILVAVTDGEDTEASLRRMEAMRTWTRMEQRGLRDIKGRDPAEIAAELQKRAVAFYAISFAHTLPEKRRKAAEKALHTLALASGGLVVDGSVKNLGPQFTRIREDLSSQYVLGFAPASGSSKNKALHRLKVEVRRKDARLRYRTAYAAAESR